jgi:predicted Zn-dependent protease
MRLSNRTIVAVAVYLLAASVASADKLKGFLWEVSPSTIVVEGQAVSLGPDTKFERQNQKDITAKDLRIGWEVEVDAREYGSGWTARNVKVMNAKNHQEEISGVIDGVEKSHFLVDGDVCRLAKGVQAPGLKPGMRFKGKGIRLDDRSVEIKDGQVMPAEFVGEEAQFMAAASQEVAQIQRQLKVVKDPELQAYVDKIGKSLVPKWVDPQQMNFTFTLVNDPSLNAFALPDGTVVVHSGLLAALENEAQLATVLGHEISHVTHRHGYKGYKDQQSKKKWFGLGSLVAGIVVGTQTDSALAGLVTGVGTQLALTAAVNGHGRKLEDEADVVGLYYMTEAGYDYMEAPEVWRVFSKYVNGQNKVTNWFFSDHSTHEARIKNLTKAINADYRAQMPRKDLRTGETEYHAAVTRLASANAVAQYDSKEYAQAARSLASAVSRNPQDARSQYNLGRVLWAQGGTKNAQQALDAYVAAIEADPTMAAPWRDIGVIFYELRDVRRAGQAFEKYLELAPDAPEGPQIRAFLDVLKNQ